MPAQCLRSRGEVFQACPDADRSILVCIVISVTPLLWAAQWPKTLVLAARSAHDSQLHSKPGYAAVATMRFTTRVAQAAATQRMSAAHSSHRVMGRSWKLCNHATQCAPRLLADAADIVETTNPSPDSVYISIAWKGKRRGPHRKRRGPHRKRSAVWRPYATCCAARGRPALHAGSMQRAHEQRTQAGHRRGARASSAHQPWS